MGIGLIYIRTKRRIWKTQRQIRNYINSLNEKLKQRNVNVSIKVEEGKIEGGYRLIIKIENEGEEELAGLINSIATRIINYGKLLNANFKKEDLPASIIVEKEEDKDNTSLLIEIKMEEELIKYEKEFEEKKKMKKATT